MLSLSFSYSDKHTVYFHWFMDDDKVFHQPKEISDFYPWVWITDMEILWKKRLKEFVRDGLYHDKPDQFYMDFDWKTE